MASWHAPGHTRRDAPARTGVDRSVDLSACRERRCRRDRCPDGNGPVRRRGAQRLHPVSRGRPGRRFTDLITLPAGLHVDREQLGDRHRRGPFLCRLPSTRCRGSTPSTTRSRPSSARCLLIFAATTAASELDNSDLDGGQPGRPSPWASWCRASCTRGRWPRDPWSTSAPPVAGGPVVSTVEDGASFGLSWIAIIAPVLVIVALALAGWFLIWMALRGPPAALVGRRTGPLFRRPSTRPAQLCRRPRRPGAR